ncbi:hypothetical protein [Streptomyces griseocarneus]|uniref:hypothetical protein n=1 Tax=Streptomyces griseocarneus TaxID=51201 RepID=UPI00167E7A45|nr:hypothetical protein [Streptomyces griseocarneus]MBZ6477098.1 hypothetical protein [Streptomyces griseocarneus]GHG70462.1 hypothetical protein GCM10018779_44540 [Streptomyces griseocarneus]
MNTYPAYPTRPAHLARTRRREQFASTLAVVLWALTAKAVAVCLAVILLIAGWSAAEGASVGEPLLQVAGVLVAAGLVLTAAYHGLRVFGLTAATRAAVVGAIALPGPLGLAVYLFTR